MTEIIDRQTAIALGLKRYFTEKPCKRGHTVERYLSDGKCMECVRIRQRVAYAYSPAKAEYTRQWRLANPEKRKAQILAQRDKNRHRIRDRSKYNREYSRRRYIKVTAAMRALRELGITF